jgi:hypothetical protein
MHKCADPSVFLSFFTPILVLLIKSCPTVIRDDLVYGLPAFKNDIGSHVEKIHNQHIFVITEPS